MFESIGNFFTSFQFVSTLALVVYWIPLAICISVYFFRWVSMYRLDLEASKKDSYSPRLTVGTLIWDLILSVTPCVNLFAMVFDCLGSVLRMIGDVFDMPLVRPRNEDIRD